MQNCDCKGKMCEAISFQKSTACKNVQKSQCNTSNMIYQVDVKAPVRIHVAAHKKIPTMKPAFQESEYTCSEIEESDEDLLTPHKPNKFLVDSILF